MRLSRTLHPCAFIACSCPFRFLENVAAGLAAYQKGGALFVSQGSNALLQRTQFFNNDAPLGSAIAIADTGTSVKVEGSVIANTTSDGVGVIYQATTEPPGDDFAIVLDTVSFRSHARPALHSAYEVLVQNCDGLGLADIVNVSLGSCATTGAFCMPQARACARIIAFTHLTWVRATGMR